MARQTVPRAAKPVKHGNTAKHASYALAFGWMKRALAHGFYLEAVTIAESVISDRLISQLCRVRALEPDVPAEKQSLGRLITLWKKAIQEPIRDGHFEDLQSATDTWRLRRNLVVHGIVKTSPGVAPPSAADFKKEAETVARDGYRLAKSICNWYTRERNRRSRRAISAAATVNDCTAVGRAPNQPLHRAGARAACPGR
jgi:hypothetical protein